MFFSSFFVKRTAEIFFIWSVSYRRTTTPERAFPAGRNLRPHGPLFLGKP